MSQAGGCTALTARPEAHRPGRAAPGARCWPRQAVQQCRRCAAPAAECRKFPWCHNTLLSPGTQRGPSDPLSSQAVLTLPQIPLEKESLNQHLRSEASTWRNTLKSTRVLCSWVLLHSFHATEWSKVHNPIWMRQKSLTHKSNLVHHCLVKWKWLNLLSKQLTLRLSFVSPQKKGNLCTI